MLHYAMTNLINNHQPDNPNTQSVASDARNIVLNRIITQITRWPDLDISPLKTYDLSPRDTRLAHAVYSHTIRRWITLEYIVNTYLNQPLKDLEPKLQAVLLVGACQILYMDHIPDYAIVNESVSWAKKRIRPKAGAMVNAILRKVINLLDVVIPSEEINSHPKTKNIQSDHDLLCRTIPRSDGGLIYLNNPILPTQRNEQLSIKTSHPLNVINMWARTMSWQQVQNLALHNLIIPPTIIYGLSNQTINDNDNLVSHEIPGFAVWQGDHEGLVQLLNTNPNTWVQDPTSYDAILLSKNLDLNGEIILDYCAGSGTKTQQLMHIHPHANIIATDVDQVRYKLLYERFANSNNVKIIDPEHILDYVAKAKLLLLDVPCSNTGVLARRIEAKYRLDSSPDNSILKLQRQILADSLRLLAPSGYILYSTCSIDPKENVKQLHNIMQYHNLKIIDEQLRMPQGLPGESLTRYSDGGYAALLQ